MGSPERLAAAPPANWCRSCGRRVNEPLVAQLCFDPCHRLERAPPETSARGLAWCALDRDARTVTLAFDTEEEVDEFVRSTPSRKRAVTKEDRIERAAAYLYESETGDKWSVAGVVLPSEDDAREHYRGLARSIHSLWEEDET